MIEKHIVGYAQKPGGETGIIRQPLRSQESFDKCFLSNVFRISAPATAQREQKPPQRLLLAAHMAYKLLLRHDRLLFFVQRFRSPEGMLLILGGLSLLFRRLFLRLRQQ